MCVAVSVCVFVCCVLREKERERKREREIKREREREREREVGESILRFNEDNKGKILRAFESNEGRNENGIEPF